MLMLMFTFVHILCDVDVDVGWLRFELFDTHVETLKGK